MGAFSYSFKKITDSFKKTKGASYKLALATTATVLHLASSIAYPFILSKAVSAQDDNSDPNDFKNNSYALIYGAVATYTLYNILYYVKDNLVKQLSNEISKTSSEEVIHSALSTSYFNFVKTINSDLITSSRSEMETTIESVFNVFPVALETIADCLMIVCFYKWEFMAIIPITTFIATAKTLFSKYFVEDFETKLAKAKYDASSLVQELIENYETLQAFDYDYKPWLERALSAQKEMTTKAVFRSDLGLVAQNLLMGSGIAGLMMFTSYLVQSGKNDSSEDRYTSDDVFYIASFLYAIANNLHHFGEAEKTMRKSMSSLQGNYKTIENLAKENRNTGRLITDLKEGAEVKFEDVALDFSSHDSSVYTRSSSIDFNSAGTNGNATADSNNTAITIEDKAPLAHNHQSYGSIDGSTSAQAIPRMEKINFTMDAKSITVLVGASGGGKSNIAKMLFRLYGCSRGKITLNGKDINTIQLDALRKYVTLVPQSPKVFGSKTLAENLRVACKDASDDNLKSVLTLVGLPLSGLDAKQLDELKYSGGQIQRLAIARALLRDSKVIIFDESTSALDNSSQAKMLELIKRLPEERGVTILMIAHRLKAVDIADKVVCLHIREENQVKVTSISGIGTPEELIRTCSEYRQLIEDEQPGRHLVSDDSVTIRRQRLGRS